MPYDDDDVFCYTYTIFDDDPSSSSGVDWTDHADIEIEADDDDDAVDQVLAIMSAEAAGLRVEDGYRPGYRIYALIWDDEGVIIAQPVYRITAEDLGVDDDYEDDEDN